MEHVVNQAAQTVPPQSTIPNGGQSGEYAAYAQEWVELYQNAADGSGMHDHTKATLEQMGIDTDQIAKTAGDQALPQTNTDPNDFLMTDINDIDQNIQTVPQPTAPANDIPETSDAPEAIGPGVEVAPISSSPSNTSLDWNARPVGEISTAQADELGMEVMNRLQADLGLSKEQAAGVVGNLYYESAGMNPHVNEFGYYEGTNPYGEPSSNVYGYGWAQWTADRKQPFIDYAAANGLEVGSPEHNYQFLVHELQNQESASLVHLKQQGTPEDAARSFRTQYERAAFPNDGPRLEQAARFAAMG